MRQAKEVAGDAGWRIARQCLDEINLDKEGSSLDAKDLGFSGSAGKSKAKSKSKM